MSAAPLGERPAGGAMPAPAARRRGPALRTLRIAGALAAAAAAAMVYALCVGSSAIAPGRVVTLLLHPDGSAASEVIHALRLPRALAAFATGGLLACSGALMQVLLRNPLADPYVLGLSGGSAVGALMAMLAGLGALLVNLAAFAGALATVALVFVLARGDLARMRRAAGDATPRMLLTGVMLGSAASAIVAVILLVSPEGRLRGMLFWLMGDLGGADTYAPGLAALAAVVLLVHPLARDLNALLRGPDVAHALGVRVPFVRRAALLAASLAAAVAVTAAGAVGFVGLVVPHALRLLLGNDQRVLLPACAVGGGTLLLLADTAARTLFAPQQLPVGVVMVVLGVPCFLALLLRGGGRA